MNMVDREFWALGMVMMAKISMVLDKKKLDHEDAQQVIHRAKVLVDQTDDLHLEDKRSPGGPVDASKVSRVSSRVSVNPGAKELHNKELIG